MAWPGSGWRSGNLLRLFSEDFYAAIRTSKIAGLLGLPSVLKTAGRTRRRLVPRHHLQWAKQTPRRRWRPTRRPLIFVSAAADAQNGMAGRNFAAAPGELNYLVKLLRAHEYDACLVTYHGQYEPWLIEHQPHISLAEFRAKIKAHPDARCVTSLAGATGFILDSPRIYFWDMELVSD